MGMSIDVRIDPQCHTRHLSFLKSKLLNNLELLGRFHIKASYTLTQPKQYLAIGFSNAGKNYVLSLENRR